MVGKFQGFLPIFLKTLFVTKLPKKVYHWDADK